MSDAEKVCTNNHPISLKIALVALLVDRVLMTSAVLAWLSLMILILLLSFRWLGYH